METQEVNVIIRLEVDISKNKNDIIDFINDMEQTYTRICSRRNRFEFSNFDIIKVIEEAEIYNVND